LFFQEKLAVSRQMERTGSKRTVKPVKQAPIIRRTLPYSSSVSAGLGGLMIWKTIPTRKAREVKTIRLDEKNKARKVIG
jgi:hypothetical protein